jgi:hypothetical protein
MHRALQDSIAQSIYRRTLEAMQDAEEIGGPEGQDYVDLMHRIAQEALTRAKTASDIGFDEEREL